ncbi:MAG: DUF4837 family protein [Bacteroidetes bacterium]|jgi:hypothetical protein|nr:DUF4837 family protein [Bacteroidota bacterium]
MYRSRLVFLTLLFSLILMASCSGDYRPEAAGPVDEVIVLMDSGEWSGESADAIRETFGRLIPTLPRPGEPAYTVTFRDFDNNSELEQLQEFRNIMIAAPLGRESNVSRLLESMLDAKIRERVRKKKSAALYREDLWARDQWTLLLTSVSDEHLAQMIRNDGEELLSHLKKREFEYRIRQIYRRGEQTGLSDSLWAKNGWSVRIQHDYVKVHESAQSVLFRRYLPENNRWMWAWWTDDVSHEFMTPGWINATRDSLMKTLVQGKRDGSYVTTDYREPLETVEIDREDGLTGYETTGIWRMTNDYMGGPFVHFTYHDPQTNRLFMIEYAQFAPGVRKRRFVRQFQAMGRTFQSDSSWTSVASDSHPGISTAKGE